MNQTAGWAPISAVLAVALLGLAGCAAAGPVTAHHSATPPHQSSSPHATPSPTARPSPTPTPEPGIGATVADSNGISFMVDSAQVVPAPEFQPNPAGDVTVAIEVSLTNHGNSSQTVSSLSDFEILGPQGQSYDQVILDSGPNAPNGNVAPGQELTGDIGYQVPPGVYSVDYTPLFQSAAPAVSIGMVG